ncbi:MAG: phosphoribosylformylglycinamidine cyclo-ligase [Armatimonadetes bacterium]|nr:phosphoribosylformylglycinamidine cyclo-ligase [Armatimonadota bacterium]
MTDQPLTYAGSGVDIDTAQHTLHNLGDAIRATHDNRVLGGVGGFGALFSAQFGEMARPVLVSSIDGVGTKTKVAAMAGDYSGIGQDIVNHCVNDILCQGARGLFFLDYFGCSKLSSEAFDAVVRGAAAACEAQGIALIGGETAEMPDVYVDDEVDVVGCIVGVVDEDQKLPRGTVMPGDCVIGLASSGLHTNGYSLARRALFDRQGMSVRDILSDGQTMAQALLAPHKCYANVVLPLLDKHAGIKSLAHITGGGLYDNIPRVTPSDIQVVLDRRSWETPEIFKLIQSAGEVSDFEMHRAFNMGIGLVMIVDKDIADEVVSDLVAAGEHAAIIGAAQRGSHDVQIV